ncbi:DNA-binding protein [Brevibacterium casei]|uniref:DNA-binding protein n=1 Tax=Brevibacterium casei TaxID=33889 RepID=UPI00223B004E|nr:DNA-binding protein [Brevibacterium casei]MCT1447325.1 DNA-binding protein [Brevibacterium casei]
MADSWLDVDGIGTHFGVTVGADSTEKVMPGRIISRLCRVHASEIDDLVRRGNVSDSTPDEDTE